MKKKEDECFPRDMCCVCVMLLKRSIIIIILK